MERNSFFKMEEKMKGNSFYKNRFVYISLVLLLIFALSSCGKKIRIVDPVELGFSCAVYYNALGGTVNKREIRETYYEPGSFLFMPSGTSNMLIEPIREGYILAGWYKAKTDILDENGKVIAYDFKAEDRWDFAEDRVYDDMSLYARWIPQGKAEYIDAETGLVMFSKNISDKSPVLALTRAAENLIKKKGYTFEGYFTSTEFTQPFDFSARQINALKPNEKDFEKEIASLYPQINLEKLSESEKILVRTVKNNLYEAYIQEYIENTKSQNIFLKYEKGLVIHVASLEDLRYKGQLSFSGLTVDGEPVDRYSIEKDIDFKGASLVMGESFSGKISGNGHSLKNISLVLNSKPIDKDKEKKLSLFENLEDAVIEDLHIENFVIKINANAGVRVLAAPLAINGKNLSLKNVSLQNIQIDTGRSDDGSAEYLLGDLFVSSENISLANTKASQFAFTHSSFAKVHRLLTR